MEQEITLTLNEREVNLVLESLGELPAKVSMDVIHKILQQGQSQLAAVRQPAEGEADKETK